MSEVLNCGKQTGRLSVVYSCRRTWASLEETGEPRERFCSACEHVVHRVHNIYDARLRAEQGECIAVPTVIAESTRERLDIGEQRIIVGMFKWTNAIRDD